MNTALSDLFGDDGDASLSSFLPLSSSSPSSSLPAALTTTAPVAQVSRYFHYNPSVAAAIIFLVLYTVASIFSLFPTVRYGKGSWFMLIVFGTGVAEVVGFAARIYLAVNVNNTSLNPLSSYVVMSSLLIISPNALALVNYMIVSRVILIAGSFNISPLYSLLRSSIVTPVFLTSDILSFAIQGSASSLLVEPGSSSLGQVVMISGLIIQLCFFSVFTCITAIIQFHPHYRALHTATPSSPADLSTQTANIGRVMRCVWITITLLYVRSIYRLIEFSTGFDGPVATIESLMYVFDSLPVLCCFAFYSIDHFGLINSLFLRAANTQLQDKPQIANTSSATSSPYYHAAPANEIGDFVNDQSSATNVGVVGKQGV